MCEKEQSWIEGKKWDLAEVKPYLGCNLDDLEKTELNTENPGQEVSPD